MPTKTGVISDIHIDINKDYAVIDELAKYSKQNELELLLIAGDISSYPELTLDAVSQLEAKSGAKVLYVPGNHDLWNKDSKYEDNDKIYELYLNDEHCLSGKTYETDNHIIIGDVAWYDYSFGNHDKFSISDFEKMTHDGRTWQDSLFNKWSQNNQKKSDWFVEKFQSQIDKNTSKKIVLMTHMITHERFAVPEEREMWKYFNAFLGSKKLKELCITNQIKYSICGHVHYRNTFMESKVTWMCRCLNYHTEWLGAKEISSQIADAMEIIYL